QTQHEPRDQSTDHPLPLHSSTEDDPTVSNAVVWSPWRGTFLSDLFEQDFTGGCVPARVGCELPVGGVPSGQVGTWNRGSSISTMHHFLLEFCHTWCHAWGRKHVVESTEDQCCDAVLLLFMSPISRRSHGISGRTRTYGFFQNGRGEKVERPPATHEVKHCPCPQGHPRPPSTPRPTLFIPYAAESCSTSKAVAELRWTMVPPRPEGCSSPEKGRETTYNRSPPKQDTTLPRSWTAPPTKMPTPPPQNRSPSHNTTITTPDARGLGQPSTSSPRAPPTWSCPPPVTADVTPRGHGPWRRPFGRRTPWTCQRWSLRYRSTHDGSPIGGSTSSPAYGKYAVPPRP